MRTAVYLRCSTDVQTVENQRREIAAYIAARALTVVGEYADEGWSGTKDRRPALDRLLTDARRRKFDLVVIYALDRLGRNLRHLLTTIEELESLRVSLVSLKDGLDLSSAAGRLQLAVLGALSAFEAERLRERTISGLQRARAQGKRLGRRPVEIAPEMLQLVDGMSIRAAARVLGVAQGTLRKARAAQQSGPAAGPTFAPADAAIRAAFAA